MNLFYFSLLLCFKRFSRGENGIRTHDTLLAYTHFPGVRLRPLGHLSVIGSNLHSLTHFQRAKLQKNVNNEL